MWIGLTVSPGQRDTDDPS